MAVDIFLKIDGIPGESPDAKHRNEIQCESFDWGVQQAGNMGNGESPLGLPSITRGKSAKAIFQNFTFKHRLDKASPKLIAACAQGIHIQTVALVLRKAGAQMTEFLKVTLKDVLVSSVTLESGGGDTIPMEVVALSYAEIEIAYIPQKVDGALDTPVTATCQVQ